MKKLIYVSATWCGPCKMFGPVMDRISQSGIRVEKIDVDKAPAVAAAYMVKSVPTVLLVDHLGEEISRFVGVKSEQQVKDFFNQN
jgi:thioredoxin 1